MESTICRLQWKKMAWFWICVKDIDSACVYKVAANQRCVYG